MALSGTAGPRGLAVFGAGGFTLQLIDLLDRHAAAGMRVVLVDDNVTGERFGYRIVAADAIDPDDTVAIAVANGRIRQAIATRLGARDYTTLIDDRAEVSRHAALDDGAIVAGFARIEPGVVIGRHCHVNVAALIAHECVVGDFVTLAPHACVSGNVRIGDRTYIGAGAVIRQGRPGAPLVIGHDVTIGMGAVVTRDIPDGATVYGNPARRRD